MPAQNPSSPVCKAILLCERTLVEEGTGKISLIGTSSNFLVDESLVTLRTEIFVEFTGANGQYGIVLEIWDLTARDVVARTAEAEIQILDPQQVTSVILPIPPMRLQNDSYHDVVVLANGMEIDRRQFGVLRGT
jgi:hypothetical protein